MGLWHTANPDTATAERVTLMCGMVTSESGSLASSSFASEQAQTVGAPLWEASAYGSGGTGHGEHGHTPQPHQHNLTIRRDSPVLPPPELVHSHFRPEFFVCAACDTMWERQVADAPPPPPAPDTLRLEPMPSLVQRRVARVG